MTKEKEQNDKKGITWYQFTRIPAEKLDAIDYHLDLVGIINCFLTVTKDNGIKPVKEIDDDFHTYQYLKGNGGEILIIQITVPHKEKRDVELHDLELENTVAKEIYPLDKQTKERKRRIISPIQNQDSAKEYLAIMQEFIDLSIV